MAAPTGEEQWFLNEIARSPKLCFKYQVLWLRSRFFYRLSNELSGEMYPEFKVASVSNAADLLLLRANYKLASVRVPTNRMPIAESTIWFARFTTGFLPHGRPVWMDRGERDTTIPALARELLATRKEAAVYLLNKIKER